MRRSNSCGRMPGGKNSKGKRRQAESLSTATSWAAVGGSTVVACGVSHGKDEPYLQSVPGAGCDTAICSAWTSRNDTLIAYLDVRRRNTSRFARGILVRWHATA